jgi:hypothetical protein
MASLLAHWAAYLRHLGASFRPVGLNGFLVDYGIGALELVAVVPEVVSFVDACAGLDASWDGPAVIVGRDPSAAVQRSFRADGSWSWIACSFQFGADGDWCEAWAEAGKSVPFRKARYATRSMNPYEHIGLRHDIEHLAATSRRCLVLADESDEAGRLGMAAMFRRRSVEFLADAADRHVELLAAWARDAEHARE